MVIFTRPVFAYGNFVHETMEFVGYILVICCVFGRIFSSVFIGGYKNDRLVMHGPFSVVRNPLYCSTLMGVLGLSLCSGHALIVVLLFAVFMVTYHFLIRREEDYLLSEFGEPYREYMERTPRLIPNFSLYKAPEEIVTKPRFVANACMDAVWWFVAFPAFELIDYLHEIQLIPTVNLF